MQDARQNEPQGGRQENRATAPGRTRDRRIRVDRILGHGLASKTDVALQRMAVDVSRHLSQVGLYVDEDGRLGTTDAFTPELLAALAEAGMTDYGLAVALGRVPDLDEVSKINKFGQALDCDAGVATDIWDGADGSLSTDVWVAPTAARVHNIVSTSANDLASTGSGMRTCTVYGLQDWSSKETAEAISMNGVTPVATANSYVIIHRIAGGNFGSGGTNAGTITATAVTDATITAAIQPGEGQTLMAIYAIPDSQTIHIKRIAASALRSVASAVADMTLLVKENADAGVAGFVTKDRWKIEGGQTTPQEYDPPKSCTGPCIIKIQTSAGANNTQVTAGFNAYVVDN